MPSPVTPKANRRKRVIIALLLIALASIACRLGTGTQGLPIGERDEVLTMGTEGDQRDVILHFPPAYDGNRQLPLIIVLHGGGGSGEQIRRQIDMDSDADEYGFILAYPDG